MDSDNYSTGGNVLNSSVHITHESSVIRPSDFDEFWNGTLDDLDTVPFEYDIQSLPMRSRKTVEVFEVRYKSYGHLWISAWYCRPRDVSIKLPGLLYTPGYQGEPVLPTDLATAGYAVLSVAPRGKLRSNKVFNPGYPGLLTHNIDDRDNYAYRGFYMDAVRGFDFLAKQPEIDNTRIGVRGSSQGGALSLLVASVRPNLVRAGSAGCPYLCSIMDATSLTRSHPYEEINDYLRTYPDREDKVRGVLNYYDIHNFVDKIVCPIIVNVGLKDDTCPPETGIAVFDAIGSTDKRLYQYEDCAHDAGSGLNHNNIINEFLKSHLEPMAV